MNPRTAAIIAALVVAGLLLLILGQPFYIMPEGTQVVITRFGEPMGNVVKAAGIHWKTPFVDVVNRFEKRMLEWDGDPNQIPTKDKRFIWVDATARWRIADPLKFLQSVGDERGAQARLDDIIDATTRDVISEEPLIEIVRTSNRELTKSLNLESSAAGEDSELNQVEKADLGREKLTRTILERSGAYMPKYGIELIDVRIKRINYIDEVREKIYERMIAERRRAAEQFRSEGQGRKAEIEGRTERDLKKITSEAYKTAQHTMGQADAEATGIYAAAYGQDPEFYDFVKSLETYEKTVDGHSTLVLTTDSEYFRYLKSSRRAAP